jgi:ribulose 1,5-bisphosphate synthetase/thiazole synthase
MRVIIVGASLTCARVLTEQSLDVAVLEAPDGEYSSIKGSMLGAPGV